MGREMKFALITGGSMVLGAIIFALWPSPRHAAPPPPVSVAQELDALSQASQAPPPAVPEYAPTWIATEQPDSSVREGGTASLSTPTSSDESKTTPPRDEQPAAPRQEFQPPPSAPEPTVVPSETPTDEPRPNPNSTPNNNSELRDMLRKGK